MQGEFSAERRAHGERMKKELQVNRANWNERTPVHAASGFYDVASFKAGRITLGEIERREVGDVSGKTLLHLQCHFGMDTMSWARLGAQATGVDFSDAAIDLARSLNDELGLNARFICSDVYGLSGALDERFDVVFTSTGVLVWMPDLDRWAEVAARHLKPGGVFYILEHHPFLNPFEASEEGEMQPVTPYFHGREFFQGGVPSYTGGVIETPHYEWRHGIGEIVTALATAGLRIEFLHEFPFCNYQRFPIMERHEDGLWRFPERNDSFPQMFSIRAAK